MIDMLFVEPSLDSQADRASMLGRRVELSIPNQETPPLESDT